ncbi:MAG TPA: DUF11 domain-containing protein [Acidimicrobiia bacterium]
MRRLSRLTLSMLLMLAFVPVVTTSIPAAAAPVDCSRGVNLGFEAPLVRTNPMGPAPNWALFAEADVPGWSTSASDGLIELWESNFLGVPSFAGGQHAEVNATQSSVLFQDIPTLEGDSINWRVAHRARTAPTNSADVSFGAPGSPTIVQTMVSPTGVWTEYDGTYVVPAGQPTTRMSMESNDAGSLGNFLDGIVLELECELSITTSFTGFSDVDSSGHTNPGDTAGFEYLVTNLGSATLQSLVVNDALGFAALCPVTILAPGASTTCTATYLLTAADVDGGSVVSDAVASATDAAGINATDNYILSEPIPAAPSIAVVKTATLDATVVVPGGRVDVGDEISYSFEVTNTGNVTLDPVQVTDPTAGPVDCPVTALASGADMVCTATLTVTQTQIDAGSVTNTATATGTFGPSDISATDSVATSLPGSPGIEVTKTGALNDSVVGPVGRADAGDRVDYTITVSNTGNITLDTISVIDPTTGSVSCPSSTLAPGASMECTTSLILSQDDIDVGAVSNSVTALGNPVSGDPDETGDDVQSSFTEETNLARVASIGLAKSLSSQTHLGEGTVEITFRFTLTNFGNVTVSDLAVTDDVASLFADLAPGGWATVSATLVGSPSWDGTAVSNLLAPGQSLAPGASGSVTARFTVVASQTTAIANTATATASIPTSAIVSDDSVDGADPDPDGDGDPSNDTSPTLVEFAGLHDLSISKTASGDSGAGRVTWTLVVRNGGPAPAPGEIIVEDTPSAGTTIVSATGAGWSCSLPPGSVVCTRQASIGAGGSSTITVVTQSPDDANTVSNTATVRGGDDNDISLGNNVASVTVAVGELPFTGITAERLVLLAILLLILGIAGVGNAWRASVARQSAT